MVRRVLCVLLVPLIAASATSNLVRVPLESGDHLRFTGSIHVGSPPRRVRVVFDTGSSDTWVTSGVADHADDGRAREGFYLGYGGGGVSGFAARTTFQLGRELGSNATGLLLQHVPVGIIDSRHAAQIPGLEAQGVVGLGMGALAQIPGSSSLMGLLAKQHGLVGPVVVSLFISSWSGAQPASQLIVGGEDPALTSANTTWLSFPVAPHDALRAPQHPSPSAGDNFGFWALRVRSVAFGNVLLPLRPSGPVALLDSGTSLLLLPQHAFDAAVQDLFDRFGKRLLTPSNTQRTTPSCRPCHVHEFPPLAFEFLMGDGRATSQRLELQGSDYVRCDPRRQECTAMIDAIDSAEISDHVDVVVLGTVFFRAYYARFDSTNRKVDIACTSDVRGACLGGLQPALDYRGKPCRSSLSDTPQPMRSLVGTCAAVTALFVLTGLRLLL